MLIFIFLTETVNESFEKVASYGLMPNMILYLIGSYNMKTASASSILLMWSAISNVMAIFGAFLSDSYLGRFRVISLGSISSLLVSPIISCFSRFFLFPGDNIFSRKMYFGSNFLQGKKILKTWQPFLYICIFLLIYSKLGFNTHREDNH